MKRIRQRFIVREDGIILPIQRKREFDTTYSGETIVTIHRYVLATSESPKRAARAVKEKGIKLISYEKRHNKFVINMQRRAANEARKYIEMERKKNNPFKKQ